MDNFKVETAFFYKNNSVRIAHRTFDALNEYVTRVQRYATIRNVKAATMKATLDGLALKLVGKTMTDSESKLWCLYVGMLSYLKEIPSDDANGTITLVNLAH